MDALLLVSFVAGLVPAALFVVAYAGRSAWRSTPAGRAVMSMMIVTAVSYVSSVATLVWPDFFKAELGTWLRVVTRTAIAAVLWNLLFVLLRAQREQVPPNDREDASR